MTLQADVHDVTELSQHWDVRPVAGLIGAEVHGVDLQAGLSDEQAADIRLILANYGVLFFPEQRIDSAGHVRFAASIGKIKMPNAYLDPSAGVAGHPEIAVFSTENGYAYQTDQWHADVSFLAEPTRYAILHMQQLPPFGGDTLWVSGYEAYDRLSETMRQMLAPLTIRHQHIHAPERRHDHPLVVQNPLSGRKALFFNNTYAFRINELTETESRALLDYLAVHSTQPEMVCRRRWNVGDVGMWENHFVQHYAVYDYGNHPRKIHRIEVDAQSPNPAFPELVQLNQGGTDDGA